jgi:uncharacterized protein (DUF4415 family)
MIAVITVRHESGAWARYAVVFTSWSIRGAVNVDGSLAPGKPMSESKERITRVTLQEATRLKGKTDYVRLDAMTDEEIAEAVVEDPDAAPLDIDWTKARLVLPPGKENVTLRIDRDVLEWFRATGKGFHTRMNAVLRAYMEAHQQHMR